MADLASKFGTKTYSTPRRTPKPNPVPNNETPQLGTSEPGSTSVQKETEEQPNSENRPSSTTNSSQPITTSGIDLDGQVTPKRRQPRPKKPEKEHKEGKLVKKPRFAVNALAKQKVPDSCRKCGKDFATEWQLAYHITTKHSSNVDPFANTISIKKTHTEYSQDFKCLTCSSVFDTIEHLGQHTVIAHGVQTIDPVTKLPVKPLGKKKKYVKTTANCETCGKLIQRGTTGMRYHILRKHTAPQDLPYPCDFDGCSKSYTTPTELVQHRRVHKDLRLFECPHQNCDSKFTKERMLKAHIEGVHGNHTYSCRLCGHECKSLTGRQHHMERYHGKIKRRCPHCYFSTQAAKDLRSHIKNTHKDKLDENGNVTKEDESKFARLSFEEKYAEELANMTENTSRTSERQTPRASRTRVDKPSPRKRKAAAAASKTTIEVVCEPDPIPSNTLTNSNAQPAQYNNQYEYQSYSNRSNSYYQSHQVPSSDHHYCQMCGNYVTDLPGHYQNYHRVTLLSFLNALTSSQQSYS